MPEPKGWYSRDYLPHFDCPGVVQAITFRLNDSMPAVLLERWEQEIKGLSQAQQDTERQKRIAAYLDTGHGECWQRDTRIAEMVEEAFLHFDGDRYRLLAWVIMPNHVHLLAEVREPWTLDKVIYSWKTWTAKRANQALMRSGAFWYRDYYDRYIRDGDHFENAMRYIHENPVKAGLCTASQAWRWSSAWKERRVVPK